MNEDRERGWTGQRNQTAGQGLTCWCGQETNAGKPPKAVSWGSMVIDASIWCELDEGNETRQEPDRPMQWMEWLRLGGRRKEGEGQGR